MSHEEREKGRKREREGRKGGKKDVDTDFPSFTNTNSQWITHRLRKLQELQGLEENSGENQ